MLIKFKFCLVSCLGSIRDIYGYLSTYFLNYESLQKPLFLKTGCQLQKAAGL